MSTIQGELEGKFSSRFWTEELLPSKKAARSFILLIIITILFTSHSWGASGSIRITEPFSTGTYYTDGNFVIRGTYVMTEDDTPNGIVTSGENPDMPPKVK